MAQTFQFTRVQALHDGAFLGRVDDFEAEVTFPEGYDHLGADDSPIESVCLAHVKALGWDCNGVTYVAQDSETLMGEERIIHRRQA
jgi:hypothetical protein